ncbi:DUF6984 family protein [Verminephrobacter aporrectodeae]|uniref:DUF6984 family protein n=1 Tax=Verminephrobacter aporrectodeae TaxID=1110389 RepID=UPI0022446571|nr:hypothetical protein [Verminephrobacter aporrectodeae]
MHAARLFSFAFDTRCNSVNGGAAPSHGAFAWNFCDGFYEHKSALGMSFAKARTLILGVMLSAAQVVSLSAENIDNLGERILGQDASLAARTDLNTIGGSITASDSLVATAGRDINVESKTRTQHNAQGSRTHVDRVAGLYVTGSAGTLLASAGRDANLIAAANRDITLTSSNAVSGSGTTLSARNNVRTPTATDTTQENQFEDEKKFNFFPSDDDLIADFYKKNGLKQPTPEQVTRAAQRDAKIRANLNAATKIALGVSALIALGGLIPTFLRGALRNPIAATQAGSITAGTAAVIMNRAVTPSDLLQQMSNPQAARVVSVSTTGYMKKIRVPTDGELRVIEFLIKKSPVSFNEDWKYGLLVQPMNNGGMGSLRLFPRQGETEDRTLGCQIGEHQFSDEDGVNVIISLNTDKDGNLFELDVWKTDFSKLIKFPNI